MSFHPDDGKYPDVPRSVLFQRGHVKRLRIKMASVCLAERPWFCTLTYPAEWIWDAKLWKRHLKVFSQRFLRRWPSAGFIWKLEFQQRGAPHFHPFIWGLRDEHFGDFLLWVSKTWNEVAGNGDQNHLLAGTRVEAKNHQPFKLAAGRRPCRGASPEGGG